MSSKRQLISLSCAAAMGFAAVAHAAAPAESGGQRDRESRAALELIADPGKRFERNLKLGALRLRYADLLADARDLGVAPERPVLNERVVKERELRDGIEELNERIASAREGAAIGSGYDGGTVAGVSTATLEAIAACESGGDPTAVNPAGYYGKYQFDLGTWASVGGTGNPAETSEAEQDYRAALLYSRAGSSPWPVCGA